MGLYLFNVQACKLWQFMKVLKQKMLAARSCARNNASTAARSPASMAAWCMATPDTNRACKVSAPFNHSTQPAIVQLQSTWLVGCCMKVAHAHALGRGKFIATVPQAQQFVTTDHMPLSIASHLQPLVLDDSSTSLQALCMGGVAHKRTAGSTRHTLSPLPYAIRPPTDKFTFLTGVSKGQADQTGMAGLASDSPAKLWRHAALLSIFGQGRGGIMCATPRAAERNIMNMTPLNSAVLYG